MKDNIYLDILDIYNLDQLRRWRNENTKKGIYRTPYLLTSDMQIDFLKNVINNRSINARYWGIFKEEAEGERVKDIDTFIGYTGLDKIQWENGNSEIALTIGPKYISKGYGSKVLSLVLKEGFKNMRLQNIYGECYKCNPNIEFWEKMIKKYNGYSTILPSRKFFNGSFFNSLYFNFNHYYFEERNK